MELQHLNVHVHNHPIPQGWLPDARVITCDQPIHFPAHRLPQDFSPVALARERTRLDAPISSVQALWLASSGTPAAAFGAAALRSFGLMPLGATIDSAQHEALLEESLREYGEIWKDLADR